MSEDYYMTRADLARAADILHLYLRDVPHGNVGSVPQELTRELMRMEQDGRSIPVALAVMKLLDDALGGNLHHPEIVEVMQFNSVTFHTMDDFTDYGPGVSRP